MPMKSGIQWNPESQVFTVDIGLFPCYGFANVARPLQREYPGAYHLTFRGKEKKPVFKTCQDRTTFLNTFRRVNKRYHWICNGDVCPAFSMNCTEERPLFQGRYKSILIQKDSHLGLCYTSVSGIINERG